MEISIPSSVAFGSRRSLRIVLPIPSRLASYLRAKTNRFLEVGWPSVHSSGVDTSVHFFGVDHQFEQLQTEESKLLWIAALARSLCVRMEKGSSRNGSVKRRCPLPAQNLQV